MKAIRVLSSAALLVALTAGFAGAHPACDAGRPETRGQSWQGQRFHRDFRARGGQYTWREAARLRAGQARIRAMERIARADGIVTPRERRMIQRARMQQMGRRFWFGADGRTV